LAHLKPGGLLALEIGDSQGPATMEILTAAGYMDAEIHTDLAGHDRVVSAKAPV
jgi:release factor glutamine methyltransferase